ncbi:hypothetical protein GU700_17260 [Methylobacterium sp. NI91]|nr:MULTISPECIES: hypothetical protein [unclassified Methylobacterium]QIJ76187.1 hypothetical protein CLZ_17255 [Methylobacterium sp. CLZ]QIJ81092.1 hypothetical protein GU700_17260 [Methylobacterium sp. NI91]
MKRFLMGVSAALLCLAPCGIVFAQGLGPVVAKIGKWELRENRDSFSDEKRCVITYIGRPNVQVSQGSIYFDYSRRGGVQSFEFRFDDEPSGGLRLPDNAEKVAGIVAISGQNFSRLMTARRFRVQVLTLIAGLSVEDISTNGLFEAYNRMLETCQKS